MSKQHNLRGLLEDILKVLRQIAAVQDKQEARRYQVAAWARIRRGKAKGETEILGPVEERETVVKAKPAKPVIPLPPAPSPAPPMQDMSKLSKEELERIIAEGR